MHTLQWSKQAGNWEVGYWLHNDGDPNWVLVAAFERAGAAAQAVNFLNGGAVHDMIVKAVADALVP